MSSGKYTNKEILQHATTHELVHTHLVFNCCTCAYADWECQCDLPKEERNNGKCLEGCEKWLNAKEALQFPKEYRDEMEAEINKEREHIERLIQVLDYYCQQCKQCDNDTTYCTPEKCSIKWAIEKQTKKE